jgi:hypothetical protein
MRLAASIRIGSLIAVLYVNIARSAARPAATASKRRLLNLRHIFKAAAILSARGVDVLAACSAHVRRRCRPFVRSAISRANISGSCAAQKASRCRQILWPSSAAIWSGCSSFVNRSEKSRACAQLRWTRQLAPRSRNRAHSALADSKRLAPMRTRYQEAAPDNLVSTTSALWSERSARYFRWSSLQDDIAATREGLPRS